MGVRDYNFNVGPETPTLPSPTTPTADEDFISKGYADAAYGPFTVNAQGTRASPIAITAGGGITPLTGVALQVIYVQGSGGAVNITANPQIVAGDAANQILIVIGCSDTNTVQIDHGDGVVSNGSRILGADFVWAAMYNATTKWVEIFYGEK